MEKHEQKSFVTSFFFLKSETWQRQSKDRNVLLKKESNLTRQLVWILSQEVSRSMRKIINSACCARAQTREPSQASRRGVRQRLLTEEPRKLFFKASNPPDSEHLKGAAETSNIQPENVWAPRKWNDQISRLNRTSPPRPTSSMPKESRRKSSHDFGHSRTGANEGGGRRGPSAKQTAQGYDERALKGAPAPAAVMDASRVPQVTITPEGGGSSREIPQEDWDVVESNLRRKLSTSSISSTGSSAVESEDDLLSDNESKSKGIVTLEQLDGGEVSPKHTEKRLLCPERSPYKVKLQKCTF